jgi:hypothetical protein
MLDQMRASLYIECSGIQNKGEALMNNGKDIDTQNQESFLKSLFNNCLTLLSSINIGSEFYKNVTEHFSPIAALLMVGIAHIRGALEIIAFMGIYVVTYMFFDYPRKKSKKAEVDNFKLQASICLRNMETAAISYEDCNNIYQGLKDNAPQQYKGFLDGEILPQGYFHLKDSKNSQRHQQINIVKEIINDINKHK